jgi:Domain of unknown function (DUF4372)/Transposase DDE domain
MNKFNSIFGQILQIFPHQDFVRAVRETRAEKGVKGFSCWGQFVAMLFCQLGQAQSLREICGGLATCLGKLKHLGVDAAPKRSTLAYANEHRPWQLYQKVFYQLLAKCRVLAQGKKPFRFKIKLHLLLDHDGYLPVFCSMTEGNVHEVNIAHTLKFPKGSILAIDRGYVDYEQFARWTEAGVFFVTREKDSAAFRVIEKREVPDNRNIIKDQLIELTGYESIKKCPHTLRRVEVWDEENERIIVLWTNHLTFGATTIASIYKDRWQIEIFFKTIKQNLKIKTFVGTSRNALLTQIWTALIAILVLKYLKFRSTLGWSLSNLVAMLRYNLFTYRDLWTWLNNPFETPPIVPDPEQFVMSYR